MAAETLASEPELELLWDVGRLRRSSPRGRPGVVLYTETCAEFLESTSPDFALVVERWLDLPHVPGMSTNTGHPRWSNASATAARTASASAE